MSLSVAPLARFLRHRAVGVRVLRSGLRRPLRTALRCRPSATLVRNASSRFGPTMPLVSARASVWQDAALGDERLLADDQVGVVGALDRAAGRRERERAEQPRARRARVALAAQAVPTASDATTWPSLKKLSDGTLSERSGSRHEILYARDGPSSRLCQSVQLAAAPRRSRRARPPPTTSARAPSRPARRACARAARRSARSQPATRAASAVDGVVVDRERQPVGGLARGRRARARVLTSASPECAALIGSAPHAAASAATIPNASGKVLGTTTASHAGSSSASSLVIEAPGEHDALVEARAPRAGSASRSAPSSPSRNASRWRSGRAASASARTRPRAPVRRSAICARRSQLAVDQRGAQALEPCAVGAEADDHEPRARHALEHERPRGEQQVDALADDQLADERDEHVALGVAGVAARSRRPARRARSRLLRPQAARPAERRLRSHGRPPPRFRRQPHARPRAPRARAGPPRRPRARGGGSARRPRRAGRGACAARCSGSPSARHRLAAVWREPTSTAAAPARPSRAASRKRSGCGLTVYSSALPWTLTAYGTSLRRALARGSPAPSRDGWRAPAAGGPALDSSRDGRDVRGDVARDLEIAALGERARLDALVAVGDVHRQQAADVRAVDRAAPRSPSRGRPSSRTRSAPPSQSPTASTNGWRSGWRSWLSRCTSWPSRTSAAASRAL